MCEAWRHNERRRHGVRFLMHVITSARAHPSPRKVRPPCGTQHNCCIAYASLPQRFFFLIGGRGAQLHRSASCAHMCASLFSRSARAACAAISHTLAHCGRQCVFPALDADLLLLFSSRLQCVGWPAEWRTALYIMVQASRATRVRVGECCVARRPLCVCGSARLA